MRFYFRSYIDVSEEDINAMVSRVKNGEDFDEVYADISPCWDDLDFYASSLVQIKVEKEVMRRIKEN